VHRPPVRRWVIAFYLCALASIPVARPTAARAEDSFPDPLPADVRGVIVPESSSITVRTFAAGLLSAFAHNHLIVFPQFTGNVIAAPDAPARSAVEVTISADSLEIRDPGISASERRKVWHSAHDVALDAAHYPTVVFRSTAVTAAQVAPGRYRLTLHGTLTLHGATRNISFPAQVTVVGGDQLRVQGETRLRQTDYGIKPITLLGGLVKTVDEVRVSFDVLVRRRE